MRFWAGLALAAIAPLYGQSIVVATFENRGTDQNLDWVGESISESMREALWTEGVRVVKREDRQEALRRLSLPASGQMTLASAIKLGEEVEADRLVYGEFLFVEAAEEDSPNRGSLQITARVIDLARKAQVTEFAEVGALEDLAKLQSEAAYHALELFRPERTLTREEFDKRHPAVKLSALENYIRGLMAPTPEQKHRFFTQAVRLDSSLWMPCYYLGKMQWEQENYREAIGWLEKVPGETPYTMEATFMLGLSRYHAGEFEGARAAFEQVLALQSRVEAVNNLGAALARLGKAEALDWFRKALERDPSDPDFHFNVGYALWKRGEYAAAAERFRAVLDREQEDPEAILLLGRCLKQSGPRAGELRMEGLERLKESLDEAGNSGQ